MVGIARAELGADVLPDHRALAEVVAEPARREGATDAYPGLVPKAAALLLAMLRLRPFDRANARVALLATVVFLNRNGLDVLAVDDELIAVVAVAATGELTVLETAAALERFVVRL
ncbi:MAG TPA: Fic family protein [Actinomycetota bacterium]|nr:Fic family protein [Actinomycetota bacterium]